MVDTFARRRTLTVPDPLGWGRVRLAVARRLDFCSEPEEQNPATGGLQAFTMSIWIHNLLAAELSAQDRQFSPRRSSRPLLHHRK